MGASYRCPTLGTAGPRPGPGWAMAREQQSSILTARAVDAGNAVEAMGCDGMTTRDGWAVAVDALYLMPAH